MGTLFLYSPWLRDRFCKDLPHFWCTHVIMLSPSLFESGRCADENSLLAGYLPSYSFRVALGCCAIIWLKGQSYTILADGVISVAACTET